MGELRCETTDLLVSQCAHCKGVLDPALVEQRRRAALLTRPGWIEARYPMTCPNCGEWSNVGDPIRLDHLLRSWVCADCG